MHSDALLGREWIDKHMQVIWQIFMFFNTCLKGECVRFFTTTTLIAKGVETIQMSTNMRFVNKLI